MTLLPDTLVDLAATGASLRVDARKLSIHQLNRLAVQAAASGATLRIVNADSLNPDQARGLAQIAGAALVFELA